MKNQEDSRLALWLGKTYLKLIKMEKLFQLAVVVARLFNLVVMSSNPSFSIFKNGNLVECFPLQMNA